MTLEEFRKNILQVVEVNYSVHSCEIFDDSFNKLCEITKIPSALGYGYEMNDITFDSLSEAVIERFRDGRYEMIVQSFIVIGGRKGSIIHMTVF